MKSPADLNKSWNCSGMGLKTKSPLLAKDARNGAPGVDIELRVYYLNDFTAAASSSFTSKTV